MEDRTEDFKNDQFVRISAIRKQIIEANKSKYENSSRVKLENEVEKRLLTTMIGALAAFEESFGQLWGHGKQEHELTADELTVRDSWLSVRKRVLDNGNMQLKKFGEGLTEYVVSWKKN